MMYWYVKSRPASLKPLPVFIKRLANLTLSTLSEVLSSAHTVNSKINNLHKKFKKGFFF